jgi:signal transduction histidine kinase
MRSPRVLALLAALLLALVGAAGAVGLVSLAGDVERSRLRFVERAGQLADSLALALADEVAEVARTQDAFEVRARLDGALIVPPPAERDEADRRRALDEPLVASARAEVDEHDRAGRAQRGDQRLLELAAREDRPALAAFAYTWLAARAKGAGRSDEARAHWNAVAERFADERDERGLAYGFAARAELLALDGNPVEGLAALHADLLADLRSNGERATLALAARVAEHAAARDPALGERFAAETRAARRPLALVGEWSRGASEWFARGAPDGARLFTFEDGEPLVIVAERVEGTDEIAGRALELQRVAERALARLEPGELAPGVLAANGELLAGAAPLANAPSALRRARAPLEGVEVTAHLADFASHAAGERRTFRLVASVFVSALLAAALAGALIVRSVQRDARRAQEREAFVAAVTHELKTPIASIRLLAELLEGGDVERERVVEFGRRTVGEAVRLSRLIDSVLGFARVARSGSSEVRERVDVGAALGEALASVEPLARERGFAVRLADVPQDVAVLAQHDALVWSVAELVENATKYGAPEGGVDIDVGLAGERVRITVSDRGPGVPPSERERVFEPFRRLGDELTRERTGIGLGLALVKGRVDALGGRVGCTERPGGGACFWIELERAATKTT